MPATWNASPRDVASRSLPRSTGDSDERGEHAAQQPVLGEAAARDEARGRRPVTVHLVEVRLDQEGDALEHGTALLQVAAVADEARLEVRPPERRGESRDAVQEERRAIVGELGVAEQGEQAVRGGALVVLEPGERRARAVDRTLEHEVRVLVVGADQAGQERRRMQRLRRRPQHEGAGAEVDVGGVEIERARGVGNDRLVAVADDDRHARPPKASVPKRCDVPVARGSTARGMPKSSSSSADQSRSNGDHRSVRAAVEASARNGRSSSSRCSRKPASGPAASRDCAAALRTSGRWSRHQRSLLAP